MRNFQVKLYESSNVDQWNDFVANAKNATFLHNRSFMEYHSDRFDDFSLIVTENQKWIAVLPANISGNEVFSHQGLTYGGLIYNDTIKLQSIIAVFKIALIFLNEHGISKLTLKIIPNIYNKKPSDELKYALFLANATLNKCETLSVLDLHQINKISAGRIEGIKKGNTKNLIIKEVDCLELFWNQILIPNLEKKYQTKPIHNLEEIQFLKNKFPKNIRQFNVYQNDEIVAGTTIFESNYVAHSQYISRDETKTENGSLDYLYHYLITNVFQDKKYFDLGSSNENFGRKINSGLTFWKESFGAQTIIQEFYEIETQNSKFLNDYLI